jgi:hypothetical protein
VSNSEENSKDDGGREGKAEERQNGKEQQKTRMKRRSSFVGTAQYVSPEASLNLWHIIYKIRELIKSLLIILKNLIRI